MGSEQKRHNDRNFLRRLALAGMAVWAAWPALGNPNFEEKLTQLQRQLATNPSNAELLFQLGDLCHDEGARDNKKAAQLAEKYFNEFLKLQPDHPKALALLGSAFTMKARDTVWPGTRLGYVKEGNRKMDRAVDLAPDDPEVRLVRAINNYHMPKFLGRERLVKQDFAWLWRKVQAAPTNFAPEFKQEIAFHHGCLMRKDDKKREAEAILREGLAFAPRSDLAAQIHEELSKTTQGAKGRNEKGQY